jgi:hypothetical protein
VPPEPEEFELITPEGRGILGSMDSFGEVTFAIYAGEGSSIRGTEMFNRMMDAFGQAAKSIRGVWNKGPAGEKSTNIDKVNELVASGMVLQDAVLHAWTVTRARKRGFDSVFVHETSQESAGVYTRIVVVIRKG